jgi:hypothetical protein
MNTDFALRTGATDHNVKKKKEKGECSKKRERENVEEKESEASCRLIFFLSFRELLLRRKIRKQ